MVTKRVDTALRAKLIEKLHLQDRASTLNHKQININLLSTLNLPTRSHLQNTLLRDKNIENIKKLVQKPIFN